MADPRPYVINASVLKLLNSAPVRNMRPSLGSLVQRKTIDIGCYPFPFMVNEENIPLDGRTVNGEKLPIRPVPFWCSENTYARYPGDPTYNNGKIVWAAGQGFIKSNLEGNDINIPSVFLYDNQMGVTYPKVKYNTAFINMDNTVPKEWKDIKEAVFGTNGAFGEVFFREEDGVTKEIANNILFKIWSGLTYDLVDGDISGFTYQFVPMLQYNSKGGTYSPFFDRYSYECLDQVFNNSQMKVVGIDPNAFWEGYGATYGDTGPGITGEFFLLNAVTAGENSGSIFVRSIDDPLLGLYLFPGVTNGIVSGKQLAINTFSLANLVPFIGEREKIGINGSRAGYIETLAFLLGTNQKFATLAGTGATASLRALDFNNPCSSSFIYDETTELGRWGYEVVPIEAATDSFVEEKDELGCNVQTYIDYLTGPTAVAHGIPHPISWMFWRGASSGGEITRYSPGFVHDYVGDDPDLGTPIYNKLEGIHDHLCYEHYDSSGLLGRVYYPLNPITSRWYNQKVAPTYTREIDGKSSAQDFGLTLDKKYQTEFNDDFKGVGSFGAVSLKKLVDANLVSLDLLGLSPNLEGVTGILFPYFIPVASFAMSGINTLFPGILDISGEFSRFDGQWKRSLFPKPPDNKMSDDPNDIPTLQQAYQYYAEGVSSAADFGSDGTGVASSPIGRDLPPSQLADLRLFSWNALTKIAPRDLENEGEIVKGSFRAIETDSYGKAEYLDPNNPNRIRMSGLNVNIDPLDYPPNALPTSEFVGLTYRATNGTQSDVRQLGCPSYINVIRWANNTSPDDASANNSAGLTAHRKLISDVTIGAATKSLAEFDPDKVVTASNPTENFSRDSRPDVPNSSSDFFTRNSNGFGNFFFVTSNDDTGIPSLAVFDSPYYLSAAEYLEKYGGDGGAAPSEIWWESVDNANLAIDSGFGSIEGLAFDMTTRLFFGNPGNWTTRPDLGFRPSTYIDFIPDWDFTTPIQGIVQALTDGVHPAFVYRLLTTNVLQTLGIETPCLTDWRFNGTPCHKLGSVMNELKTNGGIYNSYFVEFFGCNEIGVEFPTSQFDVQKGKDFFAQCAIDVDDFLGTFIYAYETPREEVYSPFPNLPINAYFRYQNIGCTGAAALEDPPLTAALSPFGLQFGEVLNIVEKIDKELPPIDLTDRGAVREDLFAYRGNTASDDGVVGATASVPTVSDWLQDKLSNILNYWNVHRFDGAGDERLQKVENVLNTLYGSDFDNYKSSFANSSTFRVWAIKPKCVEEWTPECSELADRLRNSTSWRVGVLGAQQPGRVFRDEEVNAGVATNRRAVSPPFGYDRTPVGNNTTPITSSDIVTQNEGFVGAFKTIFIEPLGLATNVLATEAQAVPRATISSTVLGKLTTIIDSSGFLRDVNQITFESGFGTKILGDNTTGNITFSVTGLTLGSLEDVGVTGATNGDILIYDGELGKWVNRPFADVVQPFLAGFTGFTGGVAGTNFFYQDSAPDAGITIGSRWMNSNTGIEYIYISDGDSFQWIQSSVDVTAETPTFNYNTTLVTGSEYAALDTDYYIGVSYAGPVLIQLPSEPDQGKTVIVKDASGFASYENRKITVVGATGSDTIDNEASAIINVNNGALQFIYKNGWRII